MARTCLTANLSIYINSFTGSDISGDGSSANPFATLQYSHDYVQQNYDLSNKFTVTYEANGNFTSGIRALSPLVGQLNETNHVFNFAAGSTVTASSSSANCCFQALYGAMFTVQQLAGNLTIMAPTANGIGGATSNGGIITFGPLVTFTNCGMNSVQTSWGGTIYLNGFYTTGNSQAFAFASGGVIQFNPGYTNYLVGSPAPTYSQGFLWAYAGGVIGVTGQIFSGSCNGQGIRTELNGMVSSGGVIVPGTYPIQQITGGQYN
jgi:hypothetical protein